MVIAVRLAPMRIHPRTLRRAAAGVLAPLLLLALVACGGDDDGGDAGGDGAGSSSAAGEQVDAEEFAKEITNAVDATTTAHVKMEIIAGGLVTTAEGDVDYTGKSPQMAMTLSAPAAGQQGFDTRIVDNVMYLSAEMLGGSGGFFSVDLDDPKNPLAKQLGGLGSFDPKETLQMFGQGLKEVTLVGTEDLDGVSTRHYHVVMDTTAMKKQMQGKVKAQVPDEIAYDVWLDDEGRLAQMEADLEEQGSMSITMSDWGKPVDIEAPPAKQVQELPTKKPTPQQ